MKKKRLLYVLIIAVIVYAGIYIYQHRVQNLGEVMKVSELDKVHFSNQPLSKDNKDIQFNRTIDDKETIKQVKKFINRYQVNKIYKKKRDNYSETVYSIFFEYKDGSITHWTIINGTDNDRIISSHPYSIYEIDNDVMNYEVLYELLR